MPGILASLYHRSWGSLLVKGIVAVVFGLAAITRPHQTLEFMVTLLGIFILVVGLVSAIGGLTHRKESRMWLLFFIPGIIAIIVGIITIGRPEAVAAFVVYLIALALLVIGAGEVYGALKLRKDIEGEWMSVLAGIVSIIFGILLFARPLRAGAVVTWVVGLFILVLGILWLVLAVRARKWKKPDSSITS